MNQKQHGTLLKVLSVAGILSGSLFLTFNFLGKTAVSQTVKPSPIPTQRCEDVKAEAGKIIGASIAGTPPTSDPRSLSSKAQQCSTPISSGGATTNGLQGCLLDVPVEGQGSCLICFVSTGGGVYSCTGGAVGTF